MFYVYLLCSEMLERAMGTHTPIGIQYLFSEWKEVLDKREHDARSIIQRSSVCAVLVAAR